MDSSAAGAPTLRDVVEAMERLYPTGTAQSWDQVGLVSGDPEQPVARVLLAVDPTLAVIAEAGRLDVDLIITHHPLLLRGIHSVAPTNAKGAAITALVVQDIALYCAHTNADVASSGVGHALAAACGLSDTAGLQEVEGMELGRVGDLDAPMSLRDFATRLAAALPTTAIGVRVSGPPEAPVRRVAVFGGAGDSAFPAVRDSGADVYVTADLRHHPALEAREEARAAARPGPDGQAAATPYLIDAGHYASEWLWLPRLADRLVAELGEAGTRLDAQVSTERTDPWEFTVGADDRTD